MAPSSLKLLTVLLTVLGCAHANIHTQEDGFTFDTPEDLPQPPIQYNSGSASQYETAIGKVFHLDLHNLPNNRDDNAHFIAKQQNTKSLPHWLVFNKKTGTFWGIPLPGDEATIHIIVTSTGDHRFAQRFELRVIDGADGVSATTRRCQSDEDSTILRLLLDKNVRAIKPKQRVVAVNDLAKFFKLPYSAFTLKPQLDKDDITDSSVVLAGPGNLQTRTSKTASYLEVAVGCDGRLWDSTAALVHSLKQQARDGTIAEVLRLPVIGWRVKTETKPAVRGKRQAVEDYGSGDYDDDEYFDYEEYEEYNDENDLGDVEVNPPGSKKPIVTSTKTSTTTTTTVAPTTSTLPTSTHPHRHHHGEIKPSVEYDPDDFSVDMEEPRVITSPATTTEDIQSPEDPGPTKIDIPKPHEALDFDAEYDYDAYDDDDEDDPVESETIVPDLARKPSTESQTNTTTHMQTHETDTTPFLPVTTANTTTTSTTTEAPTTYEIVEDTEPPVYTVVFDEGTTPVIVIAAASNVTTEKGLLNTTTMSTTTTTSTTTAATTTAETTTIANETLPTIPPSSTTTQQPETTTSEDLTTSTIRTSTTVRQISTKTETTPRPTVRYIPEPRNTKPYIEKRLQYKAVTAGKVFRYVIPKNAFKDAEDGYNLTLQVLDVHEQPIPKDSWLQYNPLRRELYGLPLHDDVSNWVYTIRATDSQGAYEQDQMTVQVQQHRLERVINQEFTLQLRIEKPQEYTHYVDWSLKVLRALGRIYNTNMSEITVRHINRTSEPVVFAWSNDSLPTNYCPRGQIEELFKMLTANDRGDPSRELSLMLGPDLRIKKVVNKDLATCEQQHPAPPVVTPSTNFSPILRNPVDKVNATLGELLIYKVKDDTFYDPEDVDPSTLNITLLTSDLEAIPPTSWLQFDNKNREFFGIPRKTGRTEYFLLCVDTGGMSAQDSLEVVVHPAVKRQYNVEFSMTIGVPYEAFSTTATLQRKFVERLMDIFEEPNPSNFHFLPFKAKRESNFDSTVVYWFNKSLPIESCPNDEIKQLEYLLHSDSRSISSRVHRIMGPDFTVSTIKVHHIGNCKSKPPVVPPPDVVVPSEETTPPHAENDIMITLILPIIIIAIMLFIAMVAACVLYRKKRMGKMNVEEDGRQSYGNKGIPVIFQEELEEKPEPGTKAPVILKEEKPPLAPPEYSKSGSVKLEDSEPYQPPPPFTRTQDTGRQSRPKPTPTYRKPPPYVPP